MKIKSNEIEMVSIDTPVPYEKNMHEHTEWRKLEGTIYSISAYGQFRNDKNGYIKKQTPTRDGYLTVNIQGKTMQSHRLVAKVWIGGLTDGLVVNHLDFNRKNNHYKNLHVCTARENQSYSAKAGRYKRYGEQNNNCKVSTERVLTIKTYLQAGLSCAEISRKMNMCRRYINDIKLGKKRRNG